ncbi:unnamed protein product, partial [Amoebophrya sp. A25]
VRFAEVLKQFGEKGHDEEAAARDHAAASDLSNDLPQQEVLQDDDPIPSTPKFGPAAGTPTSSSKRRGFGGFGGGGPGRGQRSG